MAEARAKEYAVGVRFIYHVSDENSEEPGTRIVKYLDILYDIDGHIIESFNWNKADGQKSKGSLFNAVAGVERKPPKQRIEFTHLHASIPACRWAGLDGVFLIRRGSEQRANVMVYSVDNVNGQYDSETKRQIFGNETFTYKNFHVGVLKWRQTRSHASAHKACTNRTHDVLFYVTFLGKLI